MLSVTDIGLVIATTVICTAVVTAVAALALRLNRHGSLASQVAIVVAATAASIVSSILAVMAEMFISGHDVSVLTWVIAVATTLSLSASALIIAGTVSRSVGRLVDSAQRIADGAVLQPAKPGWKEFNQIHAQLEETSVQLARARSEIEKLDAARRQFFAWISHDLRTPLAGIRALSEAIDEGYAPDAAEYIRIIRSRVDALTDLVDDLFALSTLQSGTLRLNRELVPLLDVVSDAVFDLTAAADAHGIRIVQRGIEGQMLWADARELARAIGNVLANSIRHAPDGTDIIVTAHHRDREHLLVGILDQGPGVSDEDLDHIFDIGWQASDSRSAAPAHTGSGAGLGLAIVRGIVQAHGGDVGARHVADGFELSISLPVPPSIGEAMP